MEVDAAQQVGLGVRSDGGDRIWFHGELLTVLVSGEQTAGQFAIVEHQARAGQASPLHRQPLDDETFYVLEGELSFWGSEAREPVFRGGPGSVFVAQRGVPHSFRVESAFARFLGISTPAGHDRFFRAGGETAAAPTLPPLDLHQDRERLAEACRAHAVEILGPPPA